jgi:hypothetical protein
MNDNPTKTQDPIPTMASEPKTHVANVLELPAGTTPEERLDALRNVMITGFAPILEACLSNLMLPAQREAFLIETAHFIGFYTAVQLTDDRQQKPEMRNLMQAWRKIHREMDKTVTDQLHSLSC